MGIKTPRADRMPKDTSKNGHEYLGNLFKKYHGWNARKEGVFCFGCPAWASGYGIPYIIFPVNGYKYLWSDNITDLYSYIEGDNEFFYDNLLSSFSVLWDEIKLDRLIDDVYRKAKYNDTDSPEYDRLVGDILNVADMELSKQIKKYNKNNLNKAITNHNDHEISLKCKKYYYIVWSGKIDDDLALSLFN